MTIFYTAFLVINSLMAADVVRIDKNSIESFSPLTHKYELLIADNCAHCMRQIAIMKECVKEEDVVVVIDNVSKLSEEQLKKILIKKKIPYRAYLLDAELKKAYDFKGVTPTLHMNSQKYTGIVSCDLLKTI